MLGIAAIVRLGGIPGVRGKLRLPPLPGAPGSAVNARKRRTLSALARARSVATSSTTSTATSIAASASAAPIAGFTPVGGVPSWALQMRDVVNGALSGKQNVTGAVTLAANSTTTTLKDARISAYSQITYEPLTANAAAEQAGGTMYTSDKKSGQATITHASNAQTDRTFRYAIFG